VVPLFASACPASAIASGRGESATLGRERDDPVGGLDANRPLIRAASMLSSAYARARAFGRASRHTAPDADPVRVRRLPDDAQDSCSGEPLRRAQVPAAVAVLRKLIIEPTMTHPHFDTTPGSPEDVAAERPQNPVFLLFPAATRRPQENGSASSTPAEDLAR